MPPMLHTIRHSRSVTGWTESLGCLASTMSLSRRSALTDASVTGLGSGRTAFTSTARNTAVSSVGSG